MWGNMQTSSESSLRMRFCRRGKKNKRPTRNHCKHGSSPCFFVCCWDLDSIWWGRVWTLLEKHDVEWNLGRWAYSSCSCWSLWLHCSCRVLRIGSLHKKFKMWATIAKVITSEPANWYLGLVKSRWTWEWHESLCPAGIWCTNQKVLSWILQ